jgi:2-polyprenyl-6-methoxyphenol hydroxylase-like FAD-dependent oxidoreductase
VDIVAARFPAQRRAGELLIREAFSDTHQHTACFGLEEEYIVCTSVPQKMDTSETGVSQHMRALMPKLDITDDPLDAPQLIRQQLMIADTFRRNNTLVLGDAAFSGTAVIGVYLNKAISDAIAAAELISTGKSSRDADQRTAAAYRQFIFEERMVALVYNDDLRLDGIPDLARDVYEGMPRSLFRLKAGRHGVPRTLLRNWLDVLSMANRGLARQSQGTALAPWQKTLSEVRVLTGGWSPKCNEVRPHQSL